jgi:hypothetical protein
MWVIVVVGAAPCQCFSFGPTLTTSPGRISSIGPPQRWAAMKGVADDHAEDRGGSGVRTGGTRLRVQRPANDFGNEVGRDRHQVAVGCAALSGAGHDESLAEFALARSFDRALHQRPQSRFKSTSTASNGAALTSSSPP